MKFIEKQVEDNYTGATCSCHVPTVINIDYANKTTAVVVASYVSSKMNAGGKSQLSSNTFTFREVPPYNATPYDWVLARLTEKQPEDFKPEEYSNFINPYLFAGGKIKELAA